MEKSVKNDCPVCEKTVKTDASGNFHYCESCGFNINDKIEEPTKAASDGENMNFNNVDL